MRQIYRMRPDEFIVATITVVVVVSVEQGIRLAIVLSMLDLLRFSYTPSDAVMVRDADGSWKEPPLEEATLSLGRDGDAPRWIRVDAEAIGDIEYSAAQMLRETTTSWPRAGCGWCRPRSSPGCGRRWTGSA